MRTFPRPPERIEPGPDQESVWDYPRPPRLEPTSKRITIWVNGVKIADTSRAMRVLETSHPPVYYLPPDDIQMELLSRTERRSYCEFKGGAIYYSLHVGSRDIPDIAWSYPNPTPDFAPIADYLAFYPSKVDEALVDGEQAQAQEGDFYGGWITADIIGPFKGGAGSWGW